MKQSIYACWKLNLSHNSYTMKFKEMSSLLINVVHRKNSKETIHISQFIRKGYFSQKHGDWKHFSLNWNIRKTSYYSVFSLNFNFVTCKKNMQNTLQFGKYVYSKTSHFWHCIWCPNPEKFAHPNKVLATAQYWFQPSLGYQDMF